MTDFDDDGPQPRVRAEKRNVEARSFAEVAGVSAPPGKRGGGAAIRRWDHDAERERRDLHAGLAPRRLAASGVPGRWHEARFADFELDERERAINSAFAWASGQGASGLLLWGEVGRGKSAIAAAASVERCKLGPVRWLNVADLLLTLSMPFGSAEREAAARKLQPSGNVALVLDDLDKLRPTDHAVQPLYVAVNAWVDARRPLLVTMNRSPDELADDFGERFGTPIASRLVGYCEVVEVTGRDRRLRP